MAVWSKRRVVLSAAGLCSANALTATPDSRSAAALLLLLLPNKLYNMHVKEHDLCFVSGGAANFTTLRCEHNLRERSSPYIGAQTMSSGCNFGGSLGFMV